MSKFFLLVLFFFPVLLSQQEEIKEIDSILTLWHHSAIVADAKTYFSVMSDECIFLGTDKSERWTKKEFELWSAPYFKRKYAWNIFSVSRNIFLSDDNTFAWFDEELIAGIGECRGSGVLLNQDSQWKIIQYNLALTVPNDLADDLKKLVDDYNKQDSIKPE